MDPILMQRYGLLRPGMAVLTNLMTSPASSGRAAKGRQAVRAKLEEIIIEEVFYQGLPLSEVVKDLKAQAVQRDPKKRGINFLINPSSRETVPTGIDPTTGVPVPLRSVDIASSVIQVDLPLKTYGSSTCLM
jgi:hypothetical protein